MPNYLIPTLVRSFHNIFTSIWVGGMLAMLISISPTIRKEINDPDTQGRVMDRILALQSRWIYLGIIVLLVTGMLMTRLSGQSTGLLNFSNPYSSILSIKHILVIVMTLIAVIRSTVFRKAATSKIKEKKKASMALLLANTFLGLAILVLSSMNAIL